MGGGRGIPTDSSETDPSGMQILHQFVVKTAERNPITSLIVRSRISQDFGGVCSVGWDQVEFVLILVKQTSEMDKYYIIL